jgi:glycosyltransferase involved in cell wall biosynthesis
MRIGVNCYNLILQNGGIIQYFRSLFNELLTRDTANEYVFFWYPHNAEELGRLSSERWREHAVFLNNQRSVRRHLNKLDLYFCPLNALHPRPLPVPSVVTIADIQEAFHPELFTADILYSRDRHIASSAYMADRVITHSEFTKRTLVDKYRLPEERVLVAHHFANPIFYAPHSALRGSSLLLPDAFVLFPANFWKHKNHDGLFQALRILRDDHKMHIDVVLTGFQMPNGYPVESKAIEYGISSSIHVLGHVQIEELANLYRRARMLVFPSRFEGFGIPLVEAMASGCPIAAANVTSIPEITGNAAILFDPASPRSIADAIATLWCDASLRREMSVRGRRRGDFFSSASTVKVHLSAFDQAIRTYSERRYIWNAWCYRPYHEARAVVRRAHRTLTRFSNSTNSDLLVRRHL